MENVDDNTAIFALGGERVGEDALAAATGRDIELLRFHGPSVRAKP
jgi:hypothetical protein